jgi:hypothetical protein
MEAKGIKTEEFCPKLYVLYKNFNIVLADMFYPYLAAILIRQDLNYHNKINIPIGG